MSELFHNGKQKLLRKSSLLIVGFGFARQAAGNPWFVKRDLNNAIPDGPYKDLLLPSPSSYSGSVTNLTKDGLILVNGLDSSRAGISARIIGISALGEEVLFESIIHAVTHEGRTLNGLLHIPDVVEAILKEDTFNNRVMNAITGVSPKFLNTN